MPLFEDGLTSASAPANGKVNVFAISSTDATSATEPTEKPKSNRQLKEERKRAEWAKRIAEGRFSTAKPEKPAKSEEPTPVPTTDSKPTTDKKGKKDQGKKGEKRKATTELPKNNEDLELLRKQREEARAALGSGGPVKKRKTEEKGNKDQFPLLNGVPAPKVVAATTTTTTKPTAAATAINEDDDGEERGNSKPQDGMLKAQAAKLRKQRETLPIWAHQEPLRQCLRDRDVLVMVGQTGSGKSTQIGQFFATEPWMKKRTVTTPSGKEIKVGGCIAITQPRRVAAINLAKRVAQEMGVRLGEEVGYSVRFDNKSSHKTKIKFLTDGMLLQEMLADPLLKKYSCVVVDEAHERTVGTDLAMGFLRGLVYGERRGSLKAVIMSATLGVQEMAQFFEEHRGANMLPPPEEEKPIGTIINSESSTVDVIPYFGSVALFQVPGRQYPVDIHHTAHPMQDYLEAALKTVYQIHMSEPCPGDVLVFLTGQDEIISLQKSIEEYALTLDSKMPKVWVLPLYAALPLPQQNRVFEPTPIRTRKIILATNIAETSITVSGVRHVVDCGKAKLKQYRPKLGLESLLITPISRSSAMQRSGRAGREAPGKCFRLYTEEDFAALKESTKPEILRTDVANAILILKARGCDDVVNFDYLSPPKLESLQKALEQLYSLGALDNKGKITNLGHQMAKLPLSPPLARVLIAAGEPELDCLSEVVDVIAALNTDNLFPMLLNDEQREAMEEARKAFHRSEGDHIMLLEVVRAYESYVADKIADKKHWCEQHFVSHRAMQSLLDVRKQLRQYCSSMKGVTAETWEHKGEQISPDMAERVLKAFLRGYFHQTARAGPDGGYLTVLGHQNVTIHPASILFGQRREAIMYFEYVFTTKPFARWCSAVQLDWVADASPMYLRGGV
ncbi:P-loop containing nucleoside triphosphate hydrolase protein [Pyronema omphalodes]|nr:P-loop containing nucleoside triphosphate hydrolase protein [Pyronema omphalodes]